MCHMIADSVEELHDMAYKIGMKKEWFQPKSFPHYDVCLSRKKCAIEYGAIELDRKSFIHKLRSIRNQIGDNQMSNSHIVGNRVFAIRRKSKWTWEAINGNEKVIATAPSRPKLKDKLDKLYADQDSRVEVAPQKEEPIIDKAEIEHSKLQPSNMEKVNSCPSPVKKESMRSLTLNMILNGKNDDEILENVKSKFKNTKYDRSHVKWYRSNFAKTKLISAEFAPKGSKLYKEWAKNNQK